MTDKTKSTKTPVELDEKDLDKVQGAGTKGDVKGFSSGVSQPMSIQDEGKGFSTGVDQPMVKQEK